MMTRRMIVVLILACLGGWTGFTLAADAPADAPKDDTAKPQDKNRSKDPAVNAWYDRLQESYMKADWLEFKDLYKQFPKMRLQLAPAQRSNTMYMRKTAEEFHPGWWKNTSSTRNTSFKAQIWNRWFNANYVPSETIGVTQSMLDMGRKKLNVIVSWRPTYVDNPKAFTNDNSLHIFIPEAKDYGFTLGTMAEVVVWHELGHNYISLNLPIKHVYTLYHDYGYLFQHLQEFYADLTALYHSSPIGRLFGMKLRLMNMVDYDETDAHTRGCAHGVGALLVSKFLSEPDKWPSIHFPGKVPEENVEQMTIFYIYRHVDPGWTLEEDKQLREFISKWVRTKGESALRRKGLISLPNGQKMKIMAAEDRQLQQKRDLWIKRQLEKIIADGRADDPKILEKDLKDIENTVRFVPVKKLKHQDESDRRRPTRRRRKPSEKETKPQKQDDDLDDVLGDE